MKKDTQDTHFQVESADARHRSLSAAVTDAFRVSHPMARLGAKLSEDSDKVGMSPEHCVLYLARRVSEVRQARKRSQWLWGRFYNSVTGNRTDKVGMSGAVLSNSLRWLGDPVPDGVARTDNLLVEFEVAESLEVAMREHARATGLLS